MPSSNESFGGSAAPLSLLQEDRSDTSHLSAPMFPNIVENPDIHDLDPQELERQKMEAVRYSRGVKIKDVVVETFDLSKPEDVELYKEAQKRLLILIAQDAAFVHTWEKLKIIDPTNPRFVVHLDYVEYGVEKKDHATGEKTLDGKPVKEKKK